MLALPLPRNRLMKLADGSHTTAAIVRTVVRCLELTAGKGQGSLDTPHRDGTLMLSGPVIALHV
eukprot:2779963-Amphidinium_carterae.2